MIEKPPLQRTIQVARGRYILAFLDMLGQKQVMLHLDPLPSDQAAFDKVVLDSLGMRDFMQDQIQQAFYESFEKFEQSDIEQLRRRDVALFHRLRAETNLQQYQFADTVVYYVRVNSDDCQFSAAAFSMFSAVGAAFLACLAHKIPIRGAITCGEALREDRTNEIYGGPLIRAFEIERRAGMPCVLVEDSLADTLKSIANNQGSSYLANYARTFAGGAVALLDYQTGEHASIQYLGGVVQKLSNPTWYAGLYDRAHDFVITESRKFACDPKLGPRYSRLLAYFAAHPRGSL